MLQERIDNYKRDFNSWISKQGILYQVFRAPALVGASSGAGSFIFGLLLKVVIALIILSIITLLFLSQSHTKQRFTNKVMEKMKTSLKAEEITMKGAKGGLFNNTTFPEIRINGGPESFFTSLFINQSSLDLGQLPGTKSAFNTGRVSCSKIACQFKTTQEGDTLIYAPLFDTDSWFKFQSLDVRVFEAYWGYSERTKGAIKGSKLDMTRIDGGWEATITDGTISYSWFKELNIKQISLIIKKDQFEITEAEFYKGDTTYTLNLKVDEFGEKIKLSGGGKIKNCNSEDIFNEKYKPFVKGSFSAEYTIGGYLNNTDGLDFTFKPLLKELTVVEKEAEEVRLEYYPSRFFIKHEVPLWKALTTLDNSIDNYELMPFDSNEWTVHLKNGEIHLKDGTFSNTEDDRIILNLDFEIKDPTEEYVVKKVDLNSKAELVAQLEQDNELKLKANKIILLRADFTDTGQLSYYDHLEKEDFLEILKEERHIYGQAEVSLRPESLNGQYQQKLKDAFPVEDDGRRSIKAPLSGLYLDASLDTAMELYELGKKIK